MSKYINPFTDFGFKKLFGEEANKDLLIDFLNEVLGEENHIEDLSFKPTENLPKNELDRKAPAGLSVCQRERPARAHKVNTRKQTSKLGVQNINLEKKQELIL